MPVPSPTKASRGHERPGDPATISQGLAAAWTARLFAGRPEELQALGEEWVELAGRAGDPWTQAMAAASLAGALSIGRLRSADQPDQDRARSLMEDARGTLG